MPGRTKAEKPEAALETIKRQLSKTGGTSFYLQALKISLAAPYFIPVGVLNDLRRSVLERLEAARGSACKRLEVKLKKTSHKYPVEEVDFTENILSSKAVDFYRRHGVERVERAAEFGTEIGDRPLMTLKLCLRHRLDLCAGEGSAAAAGPLYLEDSDGKLFRLDFDCASCRMTLKHKKEPGSFLQR
jgi:putative protease